MLAEAERTYSAMTERSIRLFPLRVLYARRVTGPLTQISSRGWQRFSRSIWAGLIPTTLSHSTHRLRSSSEVTFEAAMLTPIRAFTGLRPSSSAIRLGASDVR